MICLNAKVNTNIKIEKFLIKTEKELSNFFRIKIESPIIILLNSRKDIDNIYLLKTGQLNLIENWSDYEKSLINQAEKMIRSIQ